jgi:hypothetical protein
MTPEQRIEKIESMLEQLLASASYESPVPLSLRDAALASNVTLRWLRERVERREVPAYRNGEKDAWRVFPKDVKAFLMVNSNQAPTRRARVLRRAV